MLVVKLRTIRVLVLLVVTVSQTSAYFMCSIRIHRQPFNTQRAVKVNSKSADLLFAR